MSEHWTEVLDSANLPDDDVVGVDVAGRQLALYVVNGEVYATDNICTHGHARLCDGFLEDYEIECPLHQGRFDIRTGKAMCEPLTVDLKRYPVRIEDGRVFVDLG
jgi:naphthalene 1,2-dioxygenase system ferredoxin subunit